jgi:hypothetical protein
VIPRRVLMVLVTIGAVLPLALVIVLGVSQLLLAMQDTAAAAVLDRIALATAIVWGIDLVTLILALGINAIGPPDHPEGSR